MTETDTEDASAQAGILTYSYRASVIGGNCDFRLMPDVLEWSAGYNRGSVPYSDIARVRLSFRPMTMQARRFVTEIWIPRRPKLIVASTSLRGVFQQQPHDAEYRAFVGELLRRIGAAGGHARMEAGSPPLLYWPGVAVFGGVSIALIVLMLSSLVSADWRGLAILAALFAFFLWQVGTFFYRNWPDRFRPDAPPDRVLPSV